MEASMNDIPSSLPKATSQPSVNAWDELLNVVRSGGSGARAPGGGGTIDARPLGGSLKRGIDIVLAALSILAVAPLAILIVLLILATMGRPVLFAHERIGFKRKLFTCHKFRSMVRDPDEVLRRHLRENPEAEQEWIETRKLRKDPRVTFVGRMLRKSSLDELPQLINVLLGQMSCVGPRPITTDELDLYGAKAPLYLSARPGLTGLWQVSGRSSLCYSQRVALDESYVRSWSLWLDLKIMFRTISVLSKFDDAA
jgi:exopolysaccharide production protein ExoY